MMKVFEQELEARERAAVETGNAVLKRPAKEHPTTEALLTGQSPTSCCYCSGTHQSQQCESVSSIEQRKQLLRQTGRCFVCLKRGHLGRDCRSSVVCAVNRFPEISHLDLADTATCSDNLNVDILIGCDY
ncbi:hypothetical protein EMCRGX_G012994 [Ephydatia muelleri]